MAEPLSSGQERSGSAVSSETQGARPRLLGSRAVFRLGAAFTFRDFRILWLGAFTSTVGTWMQKVAQSWLVLTLTGSAFYLGLDAFLAELPILLFTLIGGVIADRHDRRYVLIGSQCVQMASALMLASLVYWDVIQVWHVFLLSFLSGCGQAFGGPAYQSLMPSLVTKQHLPNAIALNSIQFNLARVIGPLLAGLTLAAWGSAVCFGLNGLSFLVVIIALLSLRLVHIESSSGTRIIDELRGGLSYVRSQAPLRSLILLAFATTLLGLPLLTFLPVFVQNVFQEDVGLYSTMMAFSGSGAVVGALVIAWLGRFRHMGRMLLIVQACLGLLVVGFAASRSLWLSYALLSLAGAALIMVFALVTSLVQLTAPNELRGRVMSIFMMAFRGGMPVGSLVGGYAASLVTAPVILGVNGLLLTSVAGYFLLRSRAVREL